VLFILDSHIKPHEHGFIDYRARSRLSLAPLVANASYPLFNLQEISAIVKTAHSYGVKVAAHSTLQESVANLVEVDSVEHTDYYDRLSKQMTSWVPTISAFAILSQGQSWERKKASFQAFLKDYQASKLEEEELRSITSGLVSRWKIACGGDVGPYAHGDNALEMQYMHRLGASWKDVLRWCTYGGWECLRPLAFEGSPETVVKMTREREERAGEGLSEHEYMFGAVRKGWYTDILFCFDFYEL
jgi:imidazolonepropionase-like amidohydrolase